ncbi:sec-independent protein translocase protein TatC [Austwickia chelonae]|nr:twin-arginine translocase subunit TatC [Austwickia chelonae]SEW04233.1 sec-independent protein translocase protein TatC [Austwickia chelonae]
MSLVDHLRELRNRFLIAAVTVLIAVVPGWKLYHPALTLLIQPIKRQGGQVNFGGLTDPFAIQLQVAIFIALIISAPMWIYQIWAFIVPGLTKREKHTALGFFACAVPLFAAGCYLAYVTLPKAVQILLEFTPAEADNIVQAPDYIRFVTRFIIAFGLAFLLPVFLVALNLIGILPASSMLTVWRFAVVGIFVFAAVMTPTPDPFTMFTLALPMVALYFMACGIAALNDRRRARHRPDWTTQVSDDEASPL